MQRPLVVMVDDEVAILNLYRRMLDRWFDVESFSSGPDLLAALKGLEPSLFVLDWRLPVMDGLSVCRKLREQSRFETVPIAMLTGDPPTLENLQQAFDAGAQSFLYKGDSPLIGVAQIRAMVESSRRLDEHLRRSTTVLSALRHDMANQLTGVVTAAHLLEMHPAAVEPTLARDLAEILTSADQLAALLTDLGQMLGSGLDQPISVPRTVPADELFEGFLATLQSKLSVQLDLPEPNLAVMGDPERICRCFWYLIKIVETFLEGGSEVVLFAARASEGARLGLRFEPQVGAQLRGLMETRRLESIGPRRSILGVAYLRGALAAHGTDLAIGEEGVASFLLRER